MYLVAMLNYRPPKALNDLISREIKLVLRTLLRPMDVRFCFVVRAQLYQGATRLEQNTARLDEVMGYWYRLECAAVP